MESRGACPTKIDVVDILTICVVLTGFATMYWFLASTISSLETYVIMWSYGGLSHWYGVCLGVAGVGCSVRDLVSMCVVALLISVQRTLRSVVALQITESNVHQP